MLPGISGKFMAFPRPSSLEIKVSSKSCQWCIPILLPSCLPLSKSPCTLLTPSLSHTHPLLFPLLMGLATIQFHQEGHWAMPVAMGRVTEETMPARALAASVWESLRGIQVIVSRGLQGTKPLPERVCLSWCDFQHQTEPVRAVLVKGTLLMYFKP